MKIEALTVCVSYSDFLCWTILYNKSLFDRYVVVTSSNDRATRDLCEYHHVECVSTDLFFERERAFCKSNGINAGLQRLSLGDWVLHLDADVVLPPRSRFLIESADLDPAAIHGVDRIMCPDFVSWLGHVQRPEVQHSCDAFVQATSYPLGARVAKMREDGWVPCGYFQLWHPATSGICTYPDHGTADRSDIQFARQWPRRRRVLIPEIVAIHLASEEGEMGANWRGRTSAPFGPALPKRRATERSEYGS
jgi:hypothetical protein